MRSRRNVRRNIRRKTRRLLRKRGGDKELATMEEIRREKAAKTLQRHMRKLSPQLQARLKWARQ